MGAQHARDRAHLCADCQASCARIAQSRPCRRTFRALGSIRAFVARDGHDLPARDATRARRLRLADAGRSPCWRSITARTCGESSTRTTLARRRTTRWSRSSGRSSEPWLRSPPGRSSIPRSGRPSRSQTGRSPVAPVCSSRSRRPDSRGRGMRERRGSCPAGRSSRRSGWEPRPSSSSSTTIRTPRMPTLRSVSSPTVATECVRLDIPLFVEPLGYDPVTGGTLIGEARRACVIETARRLTGIGGTVLKAEFPYDAGTTDEAAWADACRGAGRGVGRALGRAVGWGGRRDLRAPGRRRLPSGRVGHGRRAVRLGARGDDGGVRARRVARGRGACSTRGHRPARERPRARRGTPGRTRSRQPRLPPKAGTGNTERP